MKTTLSFVICALMSLEGYSQFYLGLNEKEIRNIVHGDIHAVTDSTGKYLSWMDESDLHTLKVISVWLKDGISIVTRYNMFGQQSVNQQVEYFNKAYVKISDGSWKAYSGGLVYSITYAGFENPTTKKVEESFIIYLKKN
jgi:hypothetical protein